MSSSTLKVSEKLSELPYQQQGHVWSDGWIDPHLIIRFPQVRKTFEHGSLQELADDIAKKGLVQPSMVAKLSQENFNRYVAVFEKISKTRFLKANFPSELTESQDVWYYVLVAGERRYRAHMILWDTGCTSCKEEARLLGRTVEPGECFTKHFPRGYMEVRIGLNIDPEEAKSVQFRENNHVRPPVHEEAYAFCEFYDYLKTLNPKISFREFAIEVGVSVEKVRRAIWFCDLPARLRETVEAKMISYSNALELNRILQSGHMTEPDALKVINNEVDFLLMHPRIKNEDYKKRVLNLIAESQMTTLFDLSSLEMTKKGKRKVVEGHLVTRLALMNSYVLKVMYMQGNGLIGKKHIYSGTSPTKQLKNIAAEMENIFPGFKFTEEQLRSLGSLNLDT